MKKIATAAALSLALMPGINQASGVPVFDASNLAQLLEQATLLTEQLTALQQQLETLQAQYATILNLYNEMRGITGHALMFPDPVALLHDFLPVGLNPDDLLAGPLAPLAESLRSAHELYSTEALFGGEDPHVTGAAGQYQARSDFVYAYMALAQEAYERIAARRATLATFAGALATASTQKSVLDLNTRITAENALLLNDIAQLQALELMARMQDMSILHNSDGVHAMRPTGVGDLRFGQGEPSNPATTGD